APAAAGCRPGARRSPPRPGPPARRAAGTGGSASGSPPAPRPGAVPPARPPGCWTAWEDTGSGSCRGWEGGPGAGWAAGRVWGGDGGSTHRRSLTAHWSCSSRARSSSQASGPRLLSCRLVQSKTRRVAGPKRHLGGGRSPHPPHHHPTWAPQPRTLEVSSPKRSTRQPPQRGGSVSRQSQRRQERGEGRGTQALPGGAEGLRGEQDPTKPSPSSRGRKRRPAPLHSRVHLCERCSPPPGRREDCSATNGLRRTPGPPPGAPHPPPGPSGASCGATPGGTEQRDGARGHRALIAAPREAAEGLRVPACSARAGLHTERCTTGAVVLGDRSEDRQSVPALPRPLRAPAEARGAQPLSAAQGKQKRYSLEDFAPQQDGEEGPQAAGVQVAGGEVELVHLVARRAHDGRQHGALERGQLDGREVDGPEGADGLGREALVLELVQEEEVVHQLRGGQPLAAVPDDGLLHGLGDLEGCQVLDGAAQLLQDGAVAAGQQPPHEDGEELEDLVVGGLVGVPHGALHAQDAGVDLVQDVVVVVVLLFEELLRHGASDRVPVLAAQPREEAGEDFEQVEEHGQEAQGEHLGDDAQNHGGVLAHLPDELRQLLAHLLRQGLLLAQHHVEGGQVLLHGGDGEDEGVLLARLHARREEEAEDVAAEDLQEVELAFGLHLHLEALPQVLLREAGLAGHHPLVGQLAHRLGHVLHHGDVGGVGAVQHLPAEVEPQEAGVDAGQGLAGRHRPGEVEEMQRGAHQPAVRGQEAGGGDLVLALQVPRQHLHQVILLARALAVPSAAAGLAEAHLEVELLQVGVGEAADLGVAPHVLARDAAHGGRARGDDDAGLEAEGRVSWEVLPLSQAQQDPKPLTRSTRGFEKLPP
uniref:Uncharacterized protein n=1 Tax=Anser cygnoides TaxID=8845 RepID=A0A8B9E915_ANSCY